MAPLPVCEGAFLMAQVVKNLLAMQEILGLIPGLGRFPGEGNCNLLQYSCLENSMDRGAWWATAHRITESDTTEATKHALRVLMMTKYLVTRLD